MKLANEELRNRARAKRVPLWKIAKELGVCEMTVSRMLREELPDDIKARIFAIIERLGGGSDGNSKQ